MRPSGYVIVHGEIELDGRTAADLADNGVGPTPALFKGRKIWHGWPMTTVTLKTAQQDLPVLVKRALAGEEIVIEASEAAAVKLAPVAPASDQAVPAGASYRGRGALKGQLVVGPEFFEPVSA